MALRSLDIRLVEDALTSDRLWGPEEGELGTPTTPNKTSTPPNPHTHAHASCHDLGWTPDDVAHRLIWMVGAHLRRDRSSWRPRRRRNLDMAPLCRDIGSGSVSIVSDLPHAKTFLASHDASGHGRQLVEEAQLGGRRLALRIFFESLSVCFADIMLPQNEHAPSEHQPGRAGVLNAMRHKCALLVALRDVKHLRVRHEDSGFFSAWLIVLEALLFVPAETHITVEWRVTGKEAHFTYAPDAPGECVWRTLYAPLDESRPARDTVSAAAEPTGELGERMNLCLGLRFRWLLRGSRFEMPQRQAYHELLSAHIQPRHPAIVEAMRTLGARLRGGCAIGVHKRVWTPGTREYQGSRQVPTIGGFVRAVQAVVDESPVAVTHVFLATDDKYAVAHFERAFGARLVVRDGVKRVGGGLNYADATLNEVHIRSPHNPGCGVGDAVDVVIDAMLLACCDSVVHMDSNVSSAVGYLNPATRMRHVVDLLDGAKDEMNEPGYYSETGGKPPHHII